MYYNDEKIISVATYSKILKGANRGDYQSIKKYINLTWEIDADDYAGVIRIRKALIVDEFFLIDLIELPAELQDEE
jgi:hypothetical protein